MNRQLYKDALGWGFALWLIGYVLGLLLFPIIPLPMIGWIILPIGIIITLFILLKKIQGSSLWYYFKLAVAWTLIAIVFDYIFILKLFKPLDGYYKQDVYLYYVLTFVLPILAYCLKQYQKYM